MQLAIKTAPFLPEYVAVHLPDTKIHEEQLSVDNLDTFCMFSAIISKHFMNVTSTVKCSFTVKHCINLDLQLYPFYFSATKTLHYNIIIIIIVVTIVHKLLPLVFYFIFWGLTIKHLKIILKREAGS